MQHHRDQASFSQRDPRRTSGQCPVHPRRSSSYRWLYYCRQASQGNVCLPHGADDASETAKEHRRRQVDGLVRMKRAAPRRLTRAQKREHGVREAHGHQVMDSELSIAQQECALQCTIRLLAMARKMKDVCALTLKSLPKHLYGGVRGRQVQDLRCCPLEADLRDLDLPLDIE
jgi:hypothetical protein